MNWNKLHWSLPFFVCLRNCSRFRRGSPRCDGKKERGETRRNRLQFCTHTQKGMHKTSGQFISIHMSFIFSRNSGPYFMSLTTLYGTPLLGLPVVSDPYTELLVLIKSYFLFLHSWFSIPWRNILLCISLCGGGLCWEETMEFVCIKISRFQLPRGAQVFSFAIVITSR